jgi:hypothetical protein
MGRIQSLKMGTESVPENWAESVPENGTESVPEDGDGGSP